MKIPTFIKWNSNHPYRSLFDDIARLWTVGSILYLIFIVITNYTNPPIDLIFHPESGKLEVFNEYKSLKEVFGEVNVNCEGANYSYSSKYRFLDGSTTLPKGNKDFLIPDDEKFGEFVKNGTQECVDGILYLGRYLRIGDDQHNNQGLFKRQEVISFEFFTEKNGSISSIKRKEGSNHIKTNFCSKCMVDIELKARNLKKPKVSQENFSFATSSQEITFGEFYEKGVPEQNLDVIRAFFPYGKKKTPCANIEDENVCGNYLFQEINKRYPTSFPISPKYC